MDLLARSASPYNTARAQPNHRREATQERKEDLMDPEEIWISMDDAADIFSLAGVEASEGSVGAAIGMLRALLPGVGAGRLCFQVSETVFLTVGRIFEARNTQC